VPFVTSIVPHPRPHRRAAVLLALIALAAGGCGGAPKLHATVPPGEMPDQEVSDFVLTETDQGRPQWTLYARSAQTFTARQVIRVRGVRVDFFDEAGARSSELVAREGEIQQQRRDMTARGGVTLTTPEGRMTTEEMQYLNLANRIVSDRRVRVERREGDVLEGTGFESDPGLTRFEFKSQVRATVRSGSGALLERREGGQ
jgi:LPS export ABC transporter protein LptC